VLCDTSISLLAPPLHLLFPSLFRSAIIDDSEGDSGDELYDKADDNEDDDDEEDLYEARSTKRPSGRGSCVPAKPRAPSKAAKAGPKKAPPVRAAPTSAGRGKQKPLVNDDEIEDDQDQEEQWDKPQKSSGSSKQV
jgi:hypothetical protein